MEQFLKDFFSLIRQTFEKKAINLNFHDLFYHSSIFLKIKIQSNMGEQEKKRQRIYDLLNVETESKFLCLPYTK